MPRSDAIPLDDNTLAPTGRAGALPLDQSVPPSQAPAAAPAAQGQPDSWGTRFLKQQLGYDPNATTWSGAFAPLNQALEDYTRSVASNVGGDRLQSYLAGTSLAEENAKTAASRTRLGWMAPITDIAAMGPTELGAAKAIGGRIAPAIGSYLAGILASGGVGAGTGALGAYGRGQDPTTGAELGGALGAVGGLLGGVVGRGGTLPPATSTAAAEAATQRAGASLTAIPVANSDIGGGIASARQAIQAPDIAHLDKSKVLGALAKLETKSMSGLPPGMPTGLSPQAQASVLQQLGLPPMTASTPANVLNKTIKDLKGLGPVGNRAAGELQPVMDAAGATPAATALNTAYGTAQDLGRLDAMKAAANVAGGPDIAGQARRYLLSDEGQTFAPPGSPQYQAYNAIAKAPATPVSLMPTSFDIRHAGLPLTSAGIGFGIGVQQHHDPATIAEETIGGLLAGYGAHRIPPYLMYRLRDLPRQQAAIAAAPVTFSTGQFQPPLTAPASIRDAMRTLIFGQTGRY